MKLRKAILATSFLIAFFAARSQDNDLHYQILTGYLKTDCRSEVNIPDVLGYKSLKCDFHSHTIFSDGRVTPQERINEAWREGLDVIAITDHNTPQPGYIKADYNTSYNLAKSTAESRGIILIKATEYTSSKPVGHLNLLFIDDANQYADQSYTAQQAIEMAANKGAFVIYNHPGWPDMNSDLFDFQLDFLAQKKIHAMEVINSEEFYPVVIDYCNKYNIAPLSTTDIHLPIQAAYDLEKIHRNFTIVFAKYKSMESVKEAMFAARTVACAGNILVGKPEYLIELIKKSLVAANYKVDGSQFTCDITNKSDITYAFDGPNHKHITFPANKTIQFNGDLKSANVIYQVSNTYISSTKHIGIPLNFLMTADNEMAMPYINQNLTMIDPATKIEMTCPITGAEIRYTIDGTEPSEASLLYTNPFVLKNSCIISLKAFKQGMKPSRVFKVQALLNILLPDEKLKAVKNGLNFRYYEGQIQSVAEIESKGRLADQGIVAFPDISKAKVEDHFGMVFTGYIYAPVDGLYTFATKSDDGSMLKVSGITLVDNDGSHSLTKVKASVRLKKGYHSYELLYFEDYEGEALSLSWIIPGSPEE